MYPSQENKLNAVLVLHREVVVIRVSDEKTGRRFGNAAKRRGLAVKIGSGGRNGGPTKPYQLWASWAPCDLSQVRG